MIQYRYDSGYRVHTSSGNHGKPGKSRRKSAMHGKIMEFEKTVSNHGKIVEFCEIFDETTSIQKTSCQTHKTCVSNS